VEPQDELLSLIQRLVAQRVRPEHQTQFVQIVAVTVAQLMADPKFLGQLAVIQDMQRRIAMLSNENLLLKQVLQDQGRKPPPQPRKKAAAPRKRAPTKSAQRSFIQGMHDIL
jgi:hypothetical protein